MYLLKFKGHITYTIHAKNLEGSVVGGATGTTTTQNFTKVIKGDIGFPAINFSITPGERSFPTNLKGNVIPADLANSGFEIICTEGEENLTPV